MEITIKLFAYAKQYHHKPVFNKDVKKDTKVEDVIKSLKIPDGAAKVILINGERKDKSTKLNAGDELAIFPPLAGG